MTDRPSLDEMGDDALLDAIASYGVAGGSEIDPALFRGNETVECLAFANEVFSTGRMRSPSRKRAREILAALEARSEGRTP